MDPTRLTIRISALEHDLVKMRGALQDIGEKHNRLATRVLQLARVISGAGLEQAPKTDDDQANEKITPLEQDPAPALGGLPSEIAQG